MINNKQMIQHHTRTLQSRLAAVAAIIMTIVLLCIEHVRAFANQYRITSHDAMVLASAASSLTRKLSSTTLPKTVSFFSTQEKSTGSGGSSTQLNAWSIPAIAIPSMPSMPVSKALPFHALASGWYSEVDPTTKPPVYEDEYENSYSFSSPTDDWPSMSVDMTESSEAEQTNMRRGPLNAIRRVAGRVKDILV